jgi:hypothetical protein
MKVRFTHRTLDESIAAALQAIATRTATNVRHTAKPSAPKLPDPPIRRAPVAPVKAHKRPRPNAHGEIRRPPKEPPPRKAPASGDELLAMIGARRPTP